MARILTSAASWVLVGKLVGDSGRLNYLLIGNASVAGVGTFAVAAAAWERWDGTYSLLVAAPNSMAPAMMGRMAIWVLHWVASSLCTFAVLLAVFGLRLSFPALLVVPLGRRVAGLEHVRVVALPRRVDRTNPCAAKHRDQRPDHGHLGAQRRYGARGLLATVGAGHRCRLAGDACLGGDPLRPGGRPGVGRRSGVRVGDSGLPRVARARALDHRSNCTGRASQRLDPFVVNGAP